ncbi:hypothetical protein V8E54_000701 [Elaphomyces granulatus]
MVRGSSLRPDPLFLRDVLRDNLVNGKVLLNHVGKMLEKDLNKEILGLRALGNRSMMLEVIQDLRQRSVKYQANSITKRLPYTPPDPGVLLNSPGRAWDYQVSPGMKTIIREEVGEHFGHYVNGNLDKSTIPLYLILSGAGTGKSRNAAELHETTYRCFDGTYFQETNEELANFLRDPYIFHISFENGSGVQTEESDPWRAIGSRMILQLLRGTQVKPDPALGSVL